MGQKTHPIGFRLGVTRTWSSRWYADKNDYKQFLHEDIRMRQFIKKKLYAAGISRIEIERAARKAKVNIFAARPGLIIGKRGSDVDTLKKELSRISKTDLFINIVEIRRPEIDAQLVAENVALQLERRVAFRRAMKKAVTTAMRLGGKGVRVRCGGRLAGAEIARVEWYLEGRVPLQTLRADIDYGQAEAYCTYGVIGVKVWIYRGDILEERGERSRKIERPEAEAPEAPANA